MLFAGSGWWKRLSQSSGRAPRHSHRRKLAALRNDLTSSSELLTTFERFEQRVLLSSPDSRGTEFWIAFQMNYYGASVLSLQIAGETATTGLVEIPGLSFSEAFSVSPGSITSVSIPVTALITATDGVQSRGIHVTSLNEITVYGGNQIQYTTDAFLALPTDVLGTDYRVMAYRNSTSTPGSEFTVVATEDRTQLTITPQTTFGTHPAGVPYRVNLDRGQVYQFRASTGSTADTTGTLISATAPVAVFGGHTCAYVLINVIAGDHLTEQLPPLSTWGKQFATVPLATRTRGDTFRILAAQDNTEVRINGNLETTLQHGEHLETVLTVASLIVTSKPVLVAQYSNGTGFDRVVSDPFMVIVPATEQALSEYTMSTPASGFAINYVNVMTPSAGVGQIQLDGAPVSSSAFTSIAGSDFFGAQLSVSLGSHRLTSTIPFGITAYGFATFDSYGYLGGQLFATIAGVGQLLLTPETTALSIQDNVTLVATVLDNYAQPISGIGVNFAIAGKHPGIGYVVTDSSGQAAFTYQGTLVGNDTVTASLGTVQDTSTVTWNSFIQSRTGGPYTVGESGVVLLQGSGMDPEGDPMTFAWDFDYDGVTFDTDATGAASLFSAAGIDGPSTRTVALVVSDGVHFATATTTVNIVNVAPSIMEVTTSDPIQEDSSVNINVAATDPAGANDPLTYEFDFNNDGTFEVGPQGSNQVAHIFTLRGTYPVVVRVEDGDGGVTTQTVMIVVNPVNDVPTGHPQVLSTNEDIGLPITLTADDGDPEVVQGLTYTISTPPQFGTITGLNPATGELIYVPHLNYNGNDLFVFTVTDDTTAGGPARTSVPITVQLTVVPQNDAPTLSLTPPVFILEDQPTGPLNISVADVDSSLVGVLVSATSLNQGLVPDGFISVTGTGANRTIAITPLPEQNGTATIVLVANDGVGGISTSSFVLNVLPVNDAPAFTAGAAVSVRSDVGNFVLPGWASGISRGPANEGGQSLQFQIVSNSSPGLFNATPVIDPVTGDLSFTPRGDQFGSTTVGIRLRDDGGTANGGVDVSPLQTVTVTIAVPPIRRFEFNAAPTLLTAGYTSVRGTDVYDTITGPTRTFGWKTAATEADRSSLASSTLLRDGHYGRDNTFVAEIPNGTYTVSLMLGDKSFARDRLSVWADGTLVPGLTNLATAAGQFIHKSFVTTVTAGRLDLRLQDTGGDPFWMLHALEIRPQSLVDNALTLTRINPTGTGPLDGNGVSIDTYQGNNATPYALVSVRSTAGTILASQDQNPSFTGVQVQANAQGQFTFQITRPIASGNLAASLVAEEVTGAKNRNSSQIYVEPAARLFDMNFGSSPTQITPPYQGVLNTTRYSAATGFGWKSAVQGADRGLAGASDSLLRDLAFGTDGTFQVTVQPGAVYTVTLRFRDTFFHDKINVFIEGSSTPISAGLTDLTVPANTTITRTFLAASNDGVLDIRFRDLSTTGDRNWIVNAIEVVRNAPPPPLLPSPLATDAAFTPLRGL